MTISGIISIAGMPGLYKVIAQTKNGFVVESLLDKKRIPAYSHYKISTLEDISIFTTSDNVPLKDVLQKIMDKENGGPSIDHKTEDSKLKKYFDEVFSDYDKERVHISDMRKMINWYNILQKNDLLKASDDSKEEGTKIKASEEKTKITAKAKPKKANVKTSAGSKKTQGVRKTGVA